MDTQHIPDELRPPRSSKDLDISLMVVEDLFLRKIDLVVDRAIRDPYFRKGVYQTRQVIYAA